MHGMRDVDFIATFRQNHEDFYRIVLPKVPDGSIRDTLAAAATTVAWPEVAPATILWDGSETLLLRDIYKKPQFGRCTGKTTVSLRMVVEEAQRFEEAGYLLCKVIIAANPGVDGVFTSVAAGFAGRLLTLIELEDTLRYHKIRLVSIKNGEIQTES